MGKFVSLFYSAELIVMLVMVIAAEAGSQCRQSDIACSLVALRLRLLGLALRLVPNAWFSGKMSSD